MPNEDVERIMARLLAIDKKVDKLLPEIRDVSKYLKEAKELANKGKIPRKQPKKKELEKCDHMFDLHIDGVKRCRYCNEVSVGTLH